LFIRHGKPGKGGNAEIVTLHVHAFFSENYLTNQQNDFFKALK